MSFKVICIDNLGVQRLITEGAIYTVATYDEKYYRLGGHLINPFTGGDAGYAKSRFIPLSEIDETEYCIIKEKQSI